MHPLPNKLVRLLYFWLGYRDNATIPACVDVPADSALSRFVPARSGTSVIPHKAIYLQPNRAVQRWYSIHGTGKLYFVPLCSGIVIELGAGRHRVPRVCRNRIEPRGSLQNRPTDHQRVGARSGAGATLEGPPAAPHLLCY